MIVKTTSSADRPGARRSRNKKDRPGPRDPIADRGTPRVETFRSEVRMLPLLTSAFSDRSGVTAIEYALIAGFVAIAAVTLIQGIGASVSSMFGSVGAGL